MMYYYGNLAYKPKTSHRQVRLDIENRRIKEKEHEEMVARRVTTIRILYIVTLALSAIFMISKFVAVYDTEQEIKSLNRQLEQKQSYTSQKIFEMEQSIDLTEIERKAAKLGMQRPEKHQVIYVDVKTNDLSELTASDVEGLKNRSASFFDKLIQNIVGIFTIK